MTLEQLLEYSEKIREFIDEVHEYVSEAFSPLVDNLTDALWDWLSNGEDVMDKFREYAADTFKNIAQDALKAMITKNIFEPFQEQLEDLTIAYSTGQIDETAYMAAVAEFAKQASASIEAQLPVLQNAAQVIEMAMEGAGIDIVGNDTVQQSGKAGAFTTMSQDQAGKLEGLFVSGQMHWASIDDRMEDVAARMSSVQDHLRQIATNTGYSAQSLSEIKDDIKKMIRDGLKVNGLVLVNGIDIWQRYGVFLTEEKKGGRENLTAIMTASKVKGHVGVNIREQNGKRYSQNLTVANDERDVTLHFAQYAATKSDWLQNYMEFIQFLKAGTNGWLNITFTELNLTLRVFYVESSAYRPLTYLWKEGVQASRYKVKFREPNPII